MEKNELTARVIGAVIDVQRELGPGLLESAYAAALAHELHLRGLGFEREFVIPAQYKGEPVGVGYRADFLVEDQLILEVKAVEALLPVHRTQLLSYLRLSGHELGLLINFHQFPVTRAIHRVINSL